MAYQTLTQPTTYCESFQILADPLVLDPNMTQEDNESNNYQMQIRLLQTPGVLSPIVSQIQQEYPNIDYRSLRGNLNISRMGDTQTLEVSYEAGDPRQVKYVLEQLQQGYVDYSLEAQKTAEQQGLSFVQSQVDKFRNQVDSLQQQLNRFRQDRFPNPQQRSGQLSEELNSILNQQRSNRVELGRLRNLVERKQRQLGQNVDSVIAMQSLSERRLTSSCAPRSRTSTCRLPRPRASSPTAIRACRRCGSAAKPCARDCSNKPTLSWAPTI